MNKSHIIFFLGFTALSLIVFSFLKKKNVCQEVADISFVNAEFEIEPKFLVTDSSVIISTHNITYTQLYEFNNDSLKKLSPFLRNVIRPFLFQGRIVGLIDSTGQKAFKSTDGTLNKLLDHQKINSIFSFNQGSLLLIKLDGNGNLYLLNTDTGINKILIKRINALHSACYDRQSNSLIINYDNQLSLIQLNKPDQVFCLDSNLEGGKMNPFMLKNTVYYANNRNSEFYRLFKIDFGDRMYVPTIVYQSDHDLRMPKTDGKRLYFIEIINSEYLLSALDLHSNSLHKITKRGVVYEYEFFGKDKIVFSFTDFSTPKTLITYNTTENRTTNVTSRNLPIKTAITLVKPNKRTSNAYKITSDTRKIRGIILFIHAGLHFDFSPRWDPVLMNLCDNGFMIIAPNSPMSYGFGKSYYNLSFSDAVADIHYWKTHLLKEYDLPLYYLTYSAGTTLMEYALSTDGKEVAGSASLFGVPTGREAAIQVPYLYILGEKDPLIDFNKRNSELLYAQKMNSSIEIKSYADEGHMFRISDNVKNAILRLCRFFR